MNKLELLGRAGEVLDDYVLVRRGIDHSSLIYRVKPVTRWSEPTAEQLKDLIRAFGYTTQAQSMEIAQAIEAALTEKQEPVAWMHTKIDDNVITHRPADLQRRPENWEPLYTHPAPEAKQEPRLWQEGDDLTIAYLNGYGKAQERIAELEASLDVALEALELQDYGQNTDVVNKLKEVRK